MSEEQSKFSEEQRKVIEESDEFHPYDCELNLTVKFSLHRDKEPTKEEMTRAFYGYMYEECFSNIIKFLGEAKAIARTEIVTFKTSIGDESTALLNPDYSEECDCCGAGVIARDGTVIDEEARQVSNSVTGSHWLCGEHPGCASS